MPIPCTRRPRSAWNRPAVGEHAVSSQRSHRHAQRGNQRPVDPSDHPLVAQVREDPARLLERPEATRQVVRREPRMGDVEQRVRDPSRSRAHARARPAARRARSRGVRSRTSTRPRRRHRARGDGPVSAAWRCIANTSRVSSRPSARRPLSNQYRRRLATRLRAASTSPVSTNRTAARRFGSSTARWSIQCACSPLGQVVRSDPRRKVRVCLHVEAPTPATPAPAARSRPSADVRTVSRARNRSPYRRHPRPAGACSARQAGRFRRARRRRARRRVRRRACLPAGRAAAEHSRSVEQLAGCPDRAGRMTRRSRPPTCAPTGRQATRSGAGQRSGLPRAGPGWRSRASRPMPARRRARCPGAGRRGGHDLADRLALAVEVKVGSNGVGPFQEQLDRRRLVVALRRGRGRFVVLAAEWPDRHLLLA